MVARKVNASCNGFVWASGAAAKSFSLLHAVTLSSGLPAPPQGPQAWLATASHRRQLQSFPTRFSQLVLEKPVSALVRLRPNRWIFLRNNLSLCELAFPPWAVISSPMAPTRSRSRHIKSRRSEPISEIRDQLPHIPDSCRIIGFLRGFSLQCKLVHLSCCHFMA